MCLLFYNHTFYKYQSFPVALVQRAKFLSKESFKKLWGKKYSSEKRYIT